MRTRKPIRESGLLGRLRLIVGVVGCTTAAFFFAWLLLGLVPGIPSLVEVFGVSGVRTPASITIAGLLLAAIGFYEA
ncbi:MAG: hypothetical protein LC637_03805 [Xanthomonadaceae bacterium]|nr:hypothetical protein [Xanthomonadaceae bacterium]